MNYAIEILEKEARLLKKALTSWEENTYPEAKKVREDRLKEIYSVIKLIEKQEGITLRNGIYPQENQQKLF